MGDEPDSHRPLPEPPPTQCGAREFWLSLAEVAAIVVLFFVYAGYPAPDVNEAHYLTKAKHFWQPEWCAGDTFLESDDAHLVFYWTVGWLTKFLSLTSVAWLGRLVTWALLAITWHRFIRCFAAHRGYSLLAAGMALCLWDRFHLAGEWVVGGFEAKGFAMTFLFIALRHTALNQWGRAFLVLGIASSFHVLVGGWGVVGVAAALALQVRANRLDSKSRRRGVAGGLISGLLGGLISGGLLALPGLLPAVWLTAGVDSAIQQQAAEIYVDRLGHHLEIYQMSPERIAMFGLLLVTWFAMRFFFKAFDSTATRTLLPTRDRVSRDRVSRIQDVVLASVAIGVFGWLLDYFSVLLPVMDRLLRYYFFRLSDVAVPIGVVVYVVFWLRPSETQIDETQIDGKQPNEKQNNAARQLTKCGILLAVAGSLTFGFVTTPKRRIPPAFVQGLGRDLTSTERWTHWKDWQDACRWIKERTAPNTRCLTPTISQTFCWYANRPEVAVWKNIPQDASSIIRWRETMNEIHLSFIYPKPNAINPPAFVDPAPLAAKHKFAYLIAKDKPSISWPQAYRNGTFIVYRNPLNLQSKSENPQ